MTALSDLQKVDISQMTREQKEQYVQLLAERAKRLAQNKITQYYPEEGKLSRHNYPKHMEFFRKGREYTERCMMAANRIGKSEGVGAYEMTLHLTGRYPDWWGGRRYDHAISAWAAGTTGTTARDIVQYKLLGAPESFGTGMIPAKYLTKTTPKAGGVPNAVDTIFVKHISGGLSRCKIKSYAEGRKSFEGTEQDFIWLDEECPLNIYLECLIRTMTTKGSLILTFTPLEGITETVEQFLQDGIIPDEQEGNKFVIQASWDDAPHLSSEEKKQLWEALPPHQRDARAKGIPQLGSGAIYPIQEEDILVDDFPIPDHWKRAFSLDVGWNKTACLWGAVNPDTNVVYLYSEYYKGQAEPQIHCEAIKLRGDWIPGVIDSAAHGASQKDGENLFDIYLDYGLDITNANKAVEAGIYKVWGMLSSGQLKVFRSLSAWRAEFRIYRRDEKGHIVKKKDHLMDGTRYFVMSALDRAIARPHWELDAIEESEQYESNAISSITGY